MSNRYQVVVVGSGAGGAAFAWAAAQKGASVLLLEAGPPYDQSRDFHLAKNDWEQRRFPAKISTSGRQTVAPLQELDARWDDLRSWNHLDTSARKRSRRRFSGYHHVVGVGGSTLHYTGEAHRLNPAAMNMHSRFGAAADWPFSYDDLEPWYLLAEQVIGVAGPLDPGVRRRSAPYPLPAHKSSYASQKLAEGCRKLGLGWTANPVASLSRTYDGRPPCNYCGQCNRGCPRYDKGTADITFVARALATGNCELVHSSPVLRLEAGNNDRVSSLTYTTESGDTQQVKADLFVLACGAVETPRMLLNSSNAAAPEGLANESGLVGKNFMETLFWNSVGLHPEPLGSHRGLPADSICWDYNAPDAIPGVTGGCRFSPTTIEMDISGPINYARRVVGGWGREHKASMRKQFGRALSLGSIGESLPNPGSFIDLDPDAKDEHGLPRARIHSLLDEMELRRLKFMAKTSREILRAAGVDKLLKEYSSFDNFSATHVFGTCRMGTDAETSVVNAACRSHRWRNLVIADASVFPSSGGGESPSLTIYANALRAAEQVRKTLI